MARILTRKLIIKLQGGLGNQLFQYASGLGIAEKTGRELIIDISGYENDQLRNYNLDRFKISAKTTSVSEKYKRFLGFNLTTEQLVETKYFRFDPKFLNSNVRILQIAGYFQTPEYFNSEKITNKLRQEFQLKTKPSGENESALKEISKSKNSVAVHIRRGDYVADTHTNKVHGVMPLKYYYEAFQIIEKKIGNDIDLFVFSDDPGWAKQNLLTSYPTIYFSHNSPERAEEDLRLMSSCSHFIIANSTFSWWGAWLGSSSTKQVVAPAEWVKTDKLEGNQLFPKGWIVIA